MPVELSTVKNSELDENIDVKIESKTFELVSNFELNVLSFKERVPSWFVLTPNSDRYKGDEP